MYIDRQFEFRRVVRSSWKVLLFAATYSSIICFLFLYKGVDWLKLPALPVTVLGTAVSFYLGFKGNSAYGRLWEARKIWGGIVNTSRTWGIHVTGMVTNTFTEEDQELEPIHRELVYRHIAWLGALRTQLRRRKRWEHSQPLMDVRRKEWGTLDMSPEVLRSRIEAFVEPNELDWLMDRKNQASQILYMQSKRLSELHAQGLVDDFRHIELSELLETMFTLQGKAERIKNFPLPRQYATANHWFVKLFLFVVPFALINAFNADASLGVWWTVPATMALFWVFTVWDAVVDYSENPFEGLINDIPMDALARTIEIDLREMLGETDLPPAAAPIGNVLM